MAFVRVLCDVTLKKHLNQRADERVLLREVIPVGAEGVPSSGRRVLEGIVNSDGHLHVRSLQRLVGVTESDRQVWRRQSDRRLPNDVRGGDGDVCGGRLGSVEGHVREGAADLPAGQAVAAHSDAHGHAREPPRLRAGHYRLRGAGRLAWLSHLAEQVRLKRFASPERELSELRVRFRHIDAPELGFWWNPGTDG